MASVTRLFLLLLALVSTPVRGQSDALLQARYLQSPSTHVHHMFERAPSTYPTPDVSGPTPQPAWVTVYNTAKAAGKIPTWPVAKYVEGSLPQYPAGTGQDKPDPKGVCSWSSSTCNATDDIVDVPAGKWAISFDDGPQPPSTVLLNFLKTKGISALHFMIGSRILDNPAIFQATMAQDGVLGVHTWSHPYMTTMTDMQVLGELGWTMQIIYDKSNGLLPLYWRPSYGDVDNRVRAIAREVFGLKTVIWNHDTRDWCLSDATPGKSACPPGDGPQSSTELNAELQYLYTLPKTPGLMILEHEHQTRAVSGFVNNYDTAIQRGWKPCQLADCLDAPWYQNAATNKGAKSPLSQHGVANALDAHLPSGNSTSHTTSPSASSTTSAAKGEDSSTNTISKKSNDSKSTKKSSPQQEQQQSAASTKSQASSVSSKKTSKAVVDDNKVMIWLTVMTLLNFCTAK